MSTPASPTPPSPRDPAGSAASANAAAPTPADRHASLRHRLRLGLAAFFVVAGSSHFIMPHFYEPMMPPWLPAHRELITISGVAEIVGGLAVLHPRLRRAAGWGLMALLVAVFPANLHVVLDPAAGAAFGFSQTVLWLRLPFQLVFFAWVWWTCLAPAARVTDRAS